MTEESNNDSGEIYEEPPVQRGEEGFLGSPEPDAAELGLEMPEPEPDTEVGAGYNDDTVEGDYEEPTQEMAEDDVEDEQEAPVEEMTPLTPEQRKVENTLRLRRQRKERFNESLGSRYNKS